MDTQGGGHLKGVFTLLDKCLNTALSWYVVGGSKVVWLG